MMMLSSTRLAIIIFAIGIISCSTVRSSSASVIYSKIIKDSFEVYVDLPQGYKKGGNYSVVFYMDANLKSGNELRRQIKLDSNKSKLSNVIFIGIGHIGNYRVLRRRDFIPPVIKGSDTVESKDPDFGHADQFYRFLEEELIPYINKQYPNNGKFSYIGHSFGGLFGFYCFAKTSPLFRNIIAMSPSLWVNDSNFFEAEKLFYQSGKSKNNSIVLYHSCGTGEWINMVLYSSRRMKDILHERKYPGLNYIYKEHEGKDHNGTVAVSLQYVIDKLDL